MTCKGVVVYLNLFAYWIGIRKHGFRRIRSDDDDRHPMQIFRWSEKTAAFNLYICNRSIIGRNTHKIRFA